MKLRWLWNAWDYSCVIWCIWQISRVTNCTRKIFQGFVFEQTLLNFTRTSSQFQKCTFNTIYGKHWLLKNCCSRVTTFNFSGVNSCQHCQRFFPCTSLRFEWVQLKVHTVWEKFIKSLILGGTGLNRNKLKWIIGTHGHWKNQNPGGRFGATS